jgi:CRISPR-associated protein Cas2
MLVIVLESPPPRLTGYLKRLLLEVRTGVFIGDYSRSVRERIWIVVVREMREGSAVIAWSSPNESGFDFDTCGTNRRSPVSLDGLSLVSFFPEGG